MTMAPRSFIVITWWCFRKRGLKWLSADYTFSIAKKP
jgi:hypothetical protein